ncbi:MAG TPA: sigma-54 dependent transcriptional regulator [Candidatus Acidoferrales bacterium]
MSAATAFSIERGENSVLVVSPSPEVRKRILRQLPVAMSPALEATGGADALVQLEAGHFATLLVDPQLEDLNVPELVNMIHARYPRVSVILLDAAGRGKFENAESGALASGEYAAAFSQNPSTAFPARPAGSKNLLRASGEPLEAVESLPGMIGSSRKMQQLYHLARLVAPRKTAVLIIGETGTGKELVARGIHDLSQRSRGPFIVVNCAAIPESLLEAELFGFARGAFTGAVQSRLGRIHAAHGGSLLLDEVGELPLSMQAKMLRFVQEGEVQRLGSTDVFRVDTRVIAATNADLLQRVREKQFREDLYYRLAVFPLELPPLRNRSEDIFPLAQHFLVALCEQAGVEPKSFSPAAATVLPKHSWPGNVRELQHWIERAFVMAEERRVIDVAEFSLSADEA